MTKLMQLHLLYDKCEPVSIGYANHEPVEVCSCGRFFIGHASVCVSSSTLPGSRNRSKINRLVASYPVRKAQWLAYTALVKEIRGGMKAGSIGGAVTTYFARFKQEAKTNGK
jgi:hypothetical protein